MNCQEAQSNVLNYITHKLSREETREFIEHVRECPDCQDELEINYIVMIGMRQLDKGDVLSVDFQKELKEDMDRRYQQARKDEERSQSVRVLFLAFLISFLLWLLGKVLAFII